VPLRADKHETCSSVTIARNVIVRPEIPSSLNSQPATLVETPSKPLHRPLEIIAARYVILGLQFYAESELRQLNALAHGNHVTVIAARVQSLLPLPELPSEPGFKLRTISIWRPVTIISQLLFGVKAAWQVIRKIRNLDCLILDEESTMIMFPIVLLLRIFMRHRAPAFFLRIPTNPQETGGHFRTFLFSLADVATIKFATLFFDKILFITPMLASYYSIPLHIPKTKVAIWPSSVDLQCFSPRSAQEELQLRKELNLLDQVVVLYHGRLSTARGIHEAVEAFRILKMEGVKATLVLLGYGPLRNELIKHVRENKMDDVVRIPNPVNSIAEVADYIAASDAEIGPMPNHVWYRFQCFIKVLEGLAMNKPVIVSDMPGNRYLLGNSPLAVYLKDTTPRGIADGVKEYLAIKQQLDPTFGRQIASQYSTDRVAQILEKLILESRSVNR